MCLVACVWSSSAIRLDNQHADELARVLMVELISAASTAAYHPASDHGRGSQASSSCTSSPSTAAAAGSPGVSSVTPNDWCAIAAASRADVARARRGPELGADLELGAVCTTSPVCSSSISRSAEPRATTRSPRPTRRSQS